jgi:taurine dioxygenase
VRDSLGQRRHRAHPAGAGRHREEPSMSIEVVPFEAALGAEIRGVDISRTLAPADRDRIRAAWIDRLVLRFRGETMTDAALMAFTRQFGELEFSAYGLVEKKYGIKPEIDAPPEISIISNIVENGKAIGGLGSGEAFWHTDSSFVDVPPAGSFLHALEIPPSGGATCTPPTRACPTISSRRSRGAARSTA